MGVNRLSRMLNGVVLAELGPLYSQRGQLTARSLRGLVALVNYAPAGVPCRWGHERGGKIIGSVRNGRFSADETKLLGDLRIDPRAGVIGERLLHLAATNPAALGVSFVAQFNTAASADGGPPELIPTRLATLDLVEGGDATYRSDLFGNPVSRPHLGVTMPDPSGHASNATPPARASQAKGHDPHWDRIPGGVNVAMHDGTWRGADTFTELARITDENRCMRQAEVLRTCQLFGLPLQAVAAVLELQGL